MQVAQRGTSATGITTASYNTVDRQYTEINNAGTWTMTQSDDVPAGEGFTKSLKYDCTTADASLGTSHYFIHRHSFEGQDLQRLMYGTPNAKPATISFYVKSNKTGTYICEFQQLATDGSYPRSGKAFTIDSANTWEKKIVTINGNTAKFIPDSSARGIDLMIWMGAGTDFTSGTFNAGNSWTTSNTERCGALTVNIADNTANEILFTGLQVEVGDTVTEFEHRSFAEELALCKRYFFKAKFAHSAYGTTSVYPEKQYYYPVEMRANPTISITGGSASNVASNSVRYNLTGGFAHNMGPSSNGMMYIGGGGNACDITFTAEI